MPWRWNVVLISVLERHWRSKFTPGINKHLHLSRELGSHFLVRINIPSTVDIKPNMFLLALSLVHQHTNSENIFELFNDNIVACSRCFTSFSRLIKGVSPPAVCTLLSVVIDWLIFVFFLSLFFVCAGGQRQVLSAAECCSVCGLQRPSPTFQQYFDGRGYSGESEETFLSASGSPRKSWEGECRPVVI